MISLLITIVITFIMTLLFGYVVHWALHQPWAKRFNESHMVHHLDLYPPENYASETYRSAGKDSTVRTFALVSIPMVAAPVFLFIFGILSLISTVAAIITMLALGYLHNYIHDGFHVHNFWLNRVPFVKDIFHRWNHLHYLHHVDMSKNYGIFTFYFDRLFGTYWNIKK